MIDIIKAWLKNFPGWKECTWFTDYLDPIPGCVGVFPHGCQALEESLLSHVTCFGQWDVRKCYANKDL